MILGNGNRTFAAPVSYNSTGTKWHATSVSVGPNLLNTTGKLDVVVSYEGDGSNSYTGAGVDVFVGNGDGTLGGATGYATNGSPAGPAAVGDLNNDGKTDFLIPLLSGGNGNATYYRNNGAGFSTSILNPGGGYYGTVYSIGDFNGDSFLDWGLALSWWGAFANTNTDGTGGTHYVASMNDTGMANTSYKRSRTGVLTSSGKTDLVFGQYNGGQSLNGIVIYQGNGDGTFKKPVLYHTVDNFSDFAIGDFNNDGKNDIVMVTGDGVLHFLAGK